MSLQAPIEDSADVVIVGSGAGGATAARVLSEAGLSVIVLEEGPSLSPAQRSRDLLDAMGESMRDLATLTTSGTAPFPLLQGRCVGGSTAVNSGIIWRMPDDVRNDWTQRFGLGDLTLGNGLDDAFAVIERELGIGPVRDEVVGGNAGRMRAGAEALGLPGRVIVRNARDCQGAARCLQGCPHGARQSMDISYIPMAEKHGARVHSHMRVDRVRIVHGKAVGATGVALDASRRAVGSFYMHAHRAVILAAGAVFTPLLLRSSGLRGTTGDHFQAHPGAAVVGRFATPVGMGHGATQAYEVPLRDRGLKLEALSLPPELLAARLPGAGSEWQQHLSHLDYYAQWSAIARMQAHGTLRRNWLGQPRIQYKPSPQDMRMLGHGLALLVRMMFAAGAEEVYPGIATLPQRLTHPDEAAPLESLQLHPRDLHMIASHQFGGACAGQDPHTSVVDASLQTHAVQRLYAMDASVFPTNLGVNPQHSIMGVVWRAAERLANATRLADAA